MKNIVKEILKYVFFGVLAALVNTLLYLLFTRLCMLNTTFSTAFAWLLANIFSYYLNLFIVFKSKKEKIVLALLIFLGTRLLSGFGDVLTMYIFVDKLLFYDVPVKIISSGVFGLLNYLIGKYFIFKKETK